MKKIFIVDEHQSSKQNGVGTYIRNLLNCFEHSGHEVNLLSFNADEKEFMIDKPAYYMEYHIPVCAKGDFLNNGALSLSVLRLYLPDNQNNVFLISHSPCLPFLRMLKHLFPSSLRIFVIHDQGWTAPLLGNAELLFRIMESKYYPKLQEKKYKYVRKYTNIERFMYRDVHLVICLSKSTKLLLSTLYKVPDDKVLLIPNGINKQISHLSRQEKTEARKRLGISEEECIILYAGRISEAKGVVELLKAFEYLWKENHKLRLIIAGQMFNLNDYVRFTPESCTHVIYTGLIDQDRLQEWYEIADIGVLPSYTEQCSYTMMEMMMHKIPIVATDANGFDGIFEDGINAFVAKSRHNMLEKDLVKCLKRAMCLSIEERESLTINSYNTFLRLFDLKLMGTAYQMIMNNQG